MNQNESSSDTTPNKDNEVKQAAEKKREFNRQPLERAVTPDGSGYSGQREAYRESDFPLQRCDFKKNAKFDSLPIEQACFVLLGFEPPPLHYLKFKQDPFWSEQELTWDSPPEYDDVLRSLHLSIEHGNIHVQKIREGKYGTRQVCWPELIRWAKSKSYSIPVELESIVAKMEPVVAVLAPQAAPLVPTVPANTHPPAAPVQDGQAGERTDAEPWNIINPQDPPPEQPWFTPARYFARGLVKDDSTLLVKRPRLADQTAQSLFAAGFRKRGDKLPLSAGTVLKAFSNVVLGKTRELSAKVLGEN